MKAGIITLQGYDNYGNRLQNLAVSKLLESMGMEADTIVIKSKEDFLIPRDEKSTGNTIKYIMKRFMPAELIAILGNCKRAVIQGSGRKREQNFRRFNKKYLRIKSFYGKTYKELLRNKKLQEYDYFFAGSDQIWNPDSGHVEDQYFLGFAPREKRIAFIASIGADKIPAEQMERFGARLKEMRYISVREERAAELVEELAGRKADVFFDPVLLVKKEYWMKIARTIGSELPETYVLSFFLGSEPKEEIEGFARERSVPVIHMNQKEYREYYSLDPSQFLYMILHAKYILTDSFHVTAFSIIFQKQFFVFRRAQKNMENMFSRMETLLGRLGLMERIWSEKKVGICDILPEHYREVEAMLIKDQERLGRKIKEICFGCYVDVGAQGD